MGFQAGLGSPQWSLLLNLFPCPSPCSQDLRKPHPTGVGRGLPWLFFYCTVPTTVTHTGNSPVLMVVGVPSTPVPGSMAPMATWAP